MSFTERSTQVAEHASGAQRTEVLIQEARQHQRKRHHVIAVAVTALAVLVAGTAIAIGTTSNGPPRSIASPPRGSLVASLAKSPVTVRPILCLAPPYSPTAATSLSKLPTTCPAQYRVSGVTPNQSAEGYSARSGSTDPALTAYQTKKAASIHQRNVVLLDLLGVKGQGDPGERFLLGPVQFALSPSSDVASASVIRSSSGNPSPEVQIRFTDAGVRKWNATAKSNFHQQLAFVYDGLIVSAPIIEPSQYSFTSFGNKSVISGGNITFSEARRIAATL
jgi:hypothetical protein